MEYITFDLEWNQPYPGQPLHRDLTAEIIQIGAVKMDADFHIIDQFKADVKPTFYTHIKREVQQLTGISAEALRRGESFPVAAARLREWCGEEFAFITWSHEDVPVLKKNLAAFDLPEDWIGAVYDLQIVHSLQRLGKYQQTALGKVMEQEGLEQDLSAHDALHDALYTARLCEKLDMEAGISQYAAYEKEAAKGRAVQVRNCDGYQTPEAAHADPALLQFVCPDCGAAMQADGWQKQPGTRRRTVVRCPDHGEFEVRLRCQPRRDKTFRVRLAMYRMEDVLEKEREKAARKALEAAVEQGE